MSLITRIRRQKAVYWKHNDTPDQFGQTGFESPIQINVRWQDSQEEFVDEEGQAQVSTAVVFTGLDMKVKDRLKLGELDGTIQNDPFQHKDSFEVKKFSSIPNIRATEFLKRAYLK